MDKELKNRIAKRIGNNIAHLRGDRYNQAQLAQMLGISRSAIASYEAGNRIPNEEIQRKICDFFGVTPNYLRGIEDAVSFIDKDKELLIEIYNGGNSELKKDIVDYAIYRNNKEGGGNGY